MQTARLSAEKRPREAPGRSPSRVTEARRERTRRWRAGTPAPPGAGRARIGVGPGPAPRPISPDTWSEGRRGLAGRGAGPAGPGRGSGLPGLARLRPLGSLRRAVECGAMRKVVLITGASRWASFAVTAGAGHGPWEQKEWGRDHRARESLPAIPGPRTAGEGASSALGAQERVL